MLIGRPKMMSLKVLSLQAGAPIAFLKREIIDPNNLKILGFVLEGGVVRGNKENFLDARDIREISNFGIIVDGETDIIDPEDVLKVKQVMALNFDVIGLKVETKKGTKLGMVTDFVVDETLAIRQIIVKRPLLKSLTDPELVISKNEIVEITDYKIIVKDEEAKIRQKNLKEDFVPNFVNPFREPNFSQFQSRNPGEPNIE